MRLRVRAAAILVLAALGCNTEPYKIVPVSGKVTLDGLPLADAHVNFQPIGNKTTTPGPGSHGRTNANGEYTLRVVSMNRAGAVVGTHRIQISVPLGSTPVAPAGTTKDDAVPEIPDKVPAKFNTQSTLTFDVPAGGTKQADFPLTSR